MQSLDFCMHVETSNKFSYQIIPKETVVKSVKKLILYDNLVIRLISTALVCINTSNIVVLNVWKVMGPIKQNK